jgi:SAM-dependent methyltransferase
MSGHIQQCRVCASRALESALDLGEQPWGNHFLQRDEIGHEPHYPLHVLWCSHCKTAQLSFTVPKEVMFSDHTYLSGTTASLSAHFKRIAAMANDRYALDQSSKSILDIGSNDGTLLKHFKALGWDVLGVESSKTTAEIANQEGIETVHAFYNQNTQATIGRTFDVINASGVFSTLKNSTQ